MFIRFFRRIMSFLKKTSQLQAAFCPPKKNTWQMGSLAKKQDISWPRKIGSTVFHASFFQKKIYDDIQGGPLVISYQLLVISLLKKTGWKNSDEHEIKKNCYFFGSHLFSIELNCHFFKHHNCKPPSDPPKKAAAGRWEVTSKTRNTVDGRNPAPVDN